MDSSVADSGCLSRILIFLHPGWRIPDLATATKEEWENKFFPTFVVATNIKILKLFYILTVKDIWASSQRIIVIFLPRKLSISSQKFWIRNSWSGKNLFQIPDSTVKKAPVPDPQHWWPEYFTCRVLAMRFESQLRWILARVSIPSYIHIVCDDNRLSFFETFLAFLNSPLHYCFHYVSFCPDAVLVINNKHVIYLHMYVFWPGNRWQRIRSLHRVL